MKKNLLFLFLACASALRLHAQIANVHYGIETTFNDKVTVAYERNFGSLVLNTNAGTLSFSSNLALLRTNNKRTDSLLTEQETILITVQVALADGLFSLINEENDNNFHKLVGTFLVSNQSLSIDVFARINNLVDKSKLTNALLDMRFEVDPSLVKIPILSDYFNHILLFQINDGLVNQTGQ